MIIGKNQLVAFLILALLLISACSTVSSRIKDHQHQFNSYPPEVQAQIQNGRIDVGFTEEQVLIAKGKPSDKTAFRRGDKTVTLWKYAGGYATRDSSPASPALGSPYGYPTFGPSPSQSTPMAYEREYHIVEFENGKVTRWDQAIQKD
ncbi:MAG: hypothetical protein AB1540_04650 [Bdellovibrionota bacterium]